MMAVAPTTPLPGKAAHKLVEQAEAMAQQLQRVNELLHQQAEASLLNELERLSSVSGILRRESKTLTSLERERLAFWASQGWAEGMKWQEAAHATAMSDEQAQHWRQVFPLLQAELKLFLVRQQRSKTLLEASLNWVEQSVQQLGQAENELEAQAYSATTGKR